MSTPVFASLFDGADTESESFEDPIDTKTPESPLTVAPPTSLLESTPPTLVLILCRTARMAVRVPPAMSSGLSDSMAEKRYHGTSELVEDSEEDEDEEIEESLDSDSREEEEAVPGVVAAGSSGFGDSVSAPLRLGYIALRRRELAFEEDHVYSTFKGFRFKIAATGHGFYSLQQADMIHMIDKNVATVNRSLFVEPEISTQADEAQSSRVPVPLSEDPYEAIRQAYLDGADTESEPFEDPIDTETPKSPLTVAPPTSLPESTPPTLVPILRRTARMAVRIPPAMSSGLSASMAEVAAMSESAFRKRFRSSCESSSSLSSPDLPSRKHYRGTSKLVEDSEEDDDKEDEEIKESLDSNSVSKDPEDEGPVAEDEDPTTGDESLTARDEGPGMDDESHGIDDKSRGLDDEGHNIENDGFGLEEDEKAVPRGQQQAALIVGTTVSAPLGVGYGALRRQELALEEDHVYSMFEVGQGSGSALKSEKPERVSTSRQPTLTTWTDPKDGMVYIDVLAYPPPAPPVQTPHSPEWTYGSLPISLSPSVVPSPISSPMIPLTVPSHVATPATAKTEGFFTELGAQVEMHGGLIHDHAVRLEELSPTLFERSLEYEQERVAVTSEVIWRPVLALESWVGQTDAQRAALWHAISDM
ncbi:hypothetical protein Tco_0429445 [Tanacetum coccineum]